MNQYRRNILEQISYWRALAPVVDRLVRLDRAKPLILSVDEAAVLQQIFTSPDHPIPTEELYS